MMNEETKASLNKFLKEREERIKNMTLAEARDIISSTYGHSDMRMESDKALQMLLDCADKTLDEQPSFINKPCVSEGVCREDKIQVLDKIRAEIKSKIEEEEFARSVFRHEEKDTYKAEQCTGSIMAYNNVIKLIDKYKTENEE